MTLWYVSIGLQCSRCSQSWIPIPTPSAVPDVGNLAHLPSPHTQFMTHGWHLACCGPVCTLENVLKELLWRESTKFADTYHPKTCLPNGRIKPSHAIVKYETITKRSMFLFEVNILWMYPDSLSSLSQKTETDSYSPFIIATNDALEED